MKTKRVVFSVFFLMMIIAQPISAQEVEMVDVIVGDAKNKAVPGNAAQSTGPAAKSEETAWRADPVRGDIFDETLHDSLEVMRQMDAQMESMREQMDHFFEESLQDPGFDQDPFFAGDNWNSSGEEHAYEEKGKEIILHCHIPGAVEGTVNIDVDGRSVSIQGFSESRSETTQEKNGGSFQSFSTSRSSFYKQFPLHPDADPLQYDAAIEKNEVVLTFKRRT